MANSIKRRKKQKARQQIGVDRSETAGMTRTRDGFRKLANWAWIAVSLPFVTLGLKAGLLFGLAPTRGAFLISSLEGCFRGFATFQAPIFLIQHSIDFRYQCHQLFGVLFNYGLFAQLHPFFFHFSLHHRTPIWQALDGG